MQQTQRVFIFIPGYYGTALVDEQSGHSVWADPKEILLGKKTLALSVAGLDIPGTLNLAPKQIIEDVRLFGGLLREDAYNKTLNLFKTIGGHIETVGWDWRRDPLQGVRALHEKVQDVKLRFPKAEIILGSHSFGSLVSAYYLRYGTQDYLEAKENWFGLQQISKTIMAASPFRGLMGMFRNVHKGQRFFLNTNNQSPLAFATFESTYYLMPPKGFDLVRDETQKAFPIGLQDPTKWAEYGWGLFDPAHRFSPVTIDVRKNYVQTHLERAQKMFELIEAPLESRPSRAGQMLYLRGTGSSTVGEGIWYRKTGSQNTFLYYPKDFKKWMPEINAKSVYRDGDGTVPDYSSILPPAYVQMGATLVEEKLPHLGVLQHPRSQNRIHEFLLH